MKVTSIQYITVADCTIVGSSGNDAVYSDVVLNGTKYKIATYHGLGDGFFAVNGKVSESAIGSEIILT